MSDSDQTRAPLDFDEGMLRVFRRTRKKDWRHLALLIGEDGRGSVMSRGDLIAMLRANDLGALAEDAASRGAPPGSLLVLSLRCEGGAGIYLLFDRRKKKR